MSPHLLHSACSSSLALQSARLGHQPTLVVAYLDEHVQRESGDCERSTGYHHARALLAVEALDAAGAPAQAA